MGPHSPCLSHRDHPPSTAPQPSLTLHNPHSHFARQADRRGYIPDRQRATRELREEREANRRFKGSHWQPLSDEQHRQRDATAKSLDPPLRDLLRMNRELRDEIRHAVEDAQPSLPHPDIQPDYDPSQDLIVNMSWMEADEVIVEPSTDYFAPRTTHLCFHSLTATSPTSNRECDVMAQFDRGAIPSIISQDLVHRLRLPLRDRAPTRVQGIGGVVTVTKE